MCGLEFCDRDLSDDLAARVDDEQHGVAGERALGVEAECWNVNVAIRSDRQPFDAALHARCDVGQNSQHINFAAIPGIRRCRREHTDHDPDGGADLEGLHHMLPPQMI